MKLHSMINLKKKCFEIDRLYYYFYRFHFSTGGNLLKQNTTMFILSIICIRYRFSLQVKQNTRFLTIRLSK